MQTAKENVSINLGDKMTDHVVGTCSLCGGPVCVPYIWSGTLPPVPYCKICNAVKKQPYGPVVEMEKNDAPFKKGKVRMKLASCSPSYLGWLAASRTSG